jgi:hypothetical protein
VTGRASRGGTCRLILLLGLALIGGLTYTLVIPPWQGPDETGHFEYAWLIASLGWLPTREDVSPAFERELLASLYEWRYGDFFGRPLPEAMPARLDDLPAWLPAQRARTILEERFSLSYLWQALFLVPFRFQDLVTQLRIARLSSILLNMAIVWLAWRTFAELVPSHSDLICALTAVIVFLPQHTFINSMVGDGPLAEVMACLVLYCWVRLFRRGASVWTVLGIVLGTLAAIWSKTTAAFLMPLDVGLALWWSLRQPRQAWRRRQVALAGAAFAVLAVAVWVWVQSPPGSRTIEAVQQSLSRHGLLWVDQRGMTFGQALLSSYDSFWANFGWMTVPVSARWYGAVLLLTLLAVLGWLLGRQAQEDFPPWGVVLMGGAFLAALIPFVWTALLASSSGYYQFQGRYLFPATVPFAFLLVGGWAHTFPARRRRAWLGAMVVFLAIFDAWCVVGYVIPFFYSQ